MAESQLMQATDVLAKIKNTAQIDINIRWDIEIRVWLDKS
jgi:hypothetical protein